MNNLTMHDTFLLHTLMDMYFDLTKFEERVPTVPGLALGIGFNKTGDITQALKQWEVGNSDYPESSINLLLRALTQIEDHYLSEGLQNKMPAALVKFTMSAYHGVHETKNIEDNSSTAVQIIFEAPKEIVNPAIAARFSTQPLLDHTQEVDI